MDNQFKAIQDDIQVAMRDGDLKLLGNAVFALANAVANLAHRVGELEPEYITEDEAREYVDAVEDEKEWLKNHYQEHTNATQES